MGPHTMLDEGIDRCLDLIQETAAINTLFIYSHAYGGDLHKPLQWLATDHGVAPRDQRARNLPLVWVKQHDRYFTDTTLRHQKVDSSFDYADRDLFTEVVAPARKRGIKVYARILEAGPRSIENFSKVVTVNVYGKPTQTGCWNHPEYKAFWNATVEDLFRSYDLDGFQWGAERASPLTNVIQNGNDTSATCFCEHCRARGKAHGIDAERARKGFEEVLDLRAASAQRPAQACRRRRGRLPANPAALSRSPGLGLPVPAVARSGDEGDVRSDQGDQAIRAGRLARRPLGDEHGSHRARGDELRGDGALFRLPQGRGLPRGDRPARQELGRATRRRACSATSRSRTR